MSHYGQPQPANMYSRPAHAGYAPHPQQMQQQQHQQQQQQQQQQPYKGTLAPGTRVKVGNITVTVKRYLSEGGFAHVYLVTTAQPIPMPSSVTGAVGASMASSAAAERGETVHVLKRMAVPDKAALADVRREVEVHKLLRNQPNIVHFIEASATALPSGGYEIFILMEYCSGGGIISLMNARLRDRLREQEVLKIFGDVCAGLAVMHHLDPPLMHRDLKVENILMAPSTDPATVPGSRSTSSNLKATFKLCDFGSAAPVLSRSPAKSIDEVKRVEADLNKHTTLQYRAPEMVDVYQRRVIDEKADIWALGVLLYKLCYYTTPFEENGGGPLAILNVQYRIPPQPVYSDRLKALIHSMLKEQSTDRPTIDQVIVNVHTILGTRPPSSAVHYATAAASGKIAGPLPVLASSSKAPNSSIPASKTAVSDGVDASLISMGPSQQELERAEARELELQKQSITPMRRGRPQKGPASSDAAPSQMPDDNVIKSKSPEPIAKDAAPSGSAKWSVPEPKARPTQPTQSAQSAKTGPLIEGFGDSFAPAAPVSSPPNLPKRPTPPSVSPEGSGNATGERAIDKNLLRAASDAPSPAPSPLRHSPALPGFSVAPSPAASPLPPSKASPTDGAAPKASPRDELTDRFPSLADLDARFASPSSAPADTASSASRVSVPGLANRASVGAMAGRFEKPFEPQRPGSGRAALSKSATISAFSSAEDATKARSGSVSKRWQPSVLAHDQLSKKPDLPSSAPVLRKTPASRDWLTGDASDDDEKRAPAPKQKIIATPLRAPEQPDDVGGQEIEHDEQSSDDDAAEPEEASAQRPDLPPRLSADRLSSFTASAPSESDTSASAKPERPRIVPGRVKAPSWLVDAVDSPTAAERLISPSSAHAGPLSPGGDITDASAAEQLDAAARSAQHQLEELLRGPSDAATPPAATPPVAATAAAVDQEVSPVVPSAKVKAPAWDDQDDDEMHKLAQPMRAGTKKLVDVATSPVDDVVPRMASLHVADAPPARPASIVAQRSQQFTASPGEPRRPTPIRPKKGEGLARWSASTSSSNKVAAAKVGGDGAGADTKLDAAGGRARPAVGLSRDSSTNPDSASATKPASWRDSSVGGMKPWEREAALSAAALHSSVVKNTALPPASTSLHTPSSPPTESPELVETDRFNGVSSLISRWQHNVESNAPGWGHVGTPRR